MARRHLSRQGVSEFSLIDERSLVMGGGVSALDSDSGTVPSRDEIATSVLHSNDVDAADKDHKAIASTEGAVDVKNDTKEAGVKEADVKEVARASPSLSSADVLHSNDVNGADKGHNAIASTEGSADEKEADEKKVDDEGDDFEDSPAGKRQSTRVVRSFGSVYLEGAVRGLAAGVNALELETGGDASSGGGKLEDGLVITHGGRTFGKIANFLGKGAMGFVYKFEYIPHGGGER